MRSFAGRDILSHYLVNTGDVAHFRGKFLYLGGSRELQPGPHGTVNGDLSGIVAEETPWIYKPYRLPTPRAHMIPDWEKKLDAVADEARTGRLANALRERAGTHGLSPGDQEVGNAVAFVREYVEHVPAHLRNGLDCLGQMCHHCSYSTSWGIRGFIGDESNMFIQNLHPLERAREEKNYIILNFAFIFVCMKINL